VKNEVQEIEKGIFKEKLTKVFQHFNQEDDTYFTGYGICQSNTYQLAETIIFIL